MTACVNTLSHKSPVPSPDALVYDNFKAKKILGLKFRDASTSSESNDLKEGYGMGCLNWENMMMI